MANIRFKRGTKTQVNATSVVDGQILFAKDTNELYIDANNNHKKITDTNKVDKISGKGLSTNDYTNEDQNVVNCAKTDITTSYPLQDTGGQHDLQLSLLYKTNAAQGNNVQFGVDSSHNLTGQIAVDQHYNPNSINAQSGKAIAEALEDMPSSEGEVGKKTIEGGEIFNLYPNGYFNPEITNSDLVTFDGIDEYARFDYTKGWSTISQGDYRFEMDCHIYSGTPIIKIGSDANSSNPVSLLPEQDNYTSRYDKESGKYIITFTMVSTWSGNLGIRIGNYNTFAHFICANPTLYLLDNQGNPTGNNLINTFKSDYYSTSRVGNKWWRKNTKTNGYTCQTLSITIISEISNNNLKAGYISHAEGQGTWATAQMSHAEGRGNNFRCILDGFENNIINLYPTSGQTVNDLLKIKENAVFFLAGTNNGKFLYAISNAVQNGSHVEVTVNENYSSSMPNTGYAYIIMGGSTSSWAHTEGNFTNAADLEATDLEDTADEKTRQHAEGSRTLATGYAAHAEGEYTRALANQSHAAGFHTIADQVAETVVGEYNNPKYNDLFEVGNGNSSQRSNAFEVNTNGTVYVQNALKIGNTTLTESQLQQLLALISS